MFFAWCICLLCALSLADDNFFLALRVTTFAKVGTVLDRSLRLAVCPALFEKLTACTALTFDMLIVPCRTQLEQLDCWQHVASCAQRELCGSNVILMLSGYSILRACTGRFATTL